MMIRRLLSIVALCATAAQADTLTYQWDGVDGGSTYLLMYELQWRDSSGIWQGVAPVATETAQAVTPVLNAGDSIEARVRAYLDNAGTEMATSDWSDTHTYIKPPAAPTGIIVISIVVSVQ